MDVLKTAKELSQFINNVNIISLGQKDAVVVMCKENTNSFTMNRIHECFDKILNDTDILVTDAIEDIKVIKRL